MSVTCSFFVVIQPSVCMPLSISVTTNFFATYDQCDSCPTWRFLLTMISRERSLLHNSFFYIFVLFEVFSPFPLLFSATFPPPCVYTHTHIYIYIYIYIYTYSICDGAYTGHYCFFGGAEINEVMIVWTCSSAEGDKKCVQYFGAETCWKAVLHGRYGAVSATLQSANSSILQNRISWLSSQLPWVGWFCQLPEVLCQNYWLPAERNQHSNGSSVSSVLESSFIGGHNQGLPIDPWSHIESLGPHRGLTSLIRVLSGPPWIWVVPHTLVAISPSTTLALQASSWHFQTLGLCQMKPVYLEGYIL
jgi:hypothetical protein